MRVIIYEPEPRMCGPMTWAFHLQEGFQRLGHEAHLLCSSKSGKARVSWGQPQSSGGGRWWSREPDIVVAHSELVSVLDDADVIVMPEIRNPPQDNDAKKEGGLPVYAQALHATKTPWTTSLHGSLYPPDSAPFIEAVLAAPMLGTPLTVSEFSMPSHPAFATRNFQRIEMPYVLRNPIDAPATLQPVVGMLGRFMPNKGPHVGMLAACEYLSDRYVYEQWGSSSKGAGCSPTYDVWNLLQELYPESQAIRYFKEYEVYPGNKTNPYHWDFRAPGRALIRYMGNYTDPVATASRLGVHCALTSCKFAGGLVEYSTLEAADAGALCITPRHFSDERFRMLVLDQYTDTATPKTTINKRMDTDVAEVGQAFLTCLQIIEETPNVAHEIVAHNRHVASVRNDPARIAQEVITAAYTRS